ncbi:MAG TPA: GlsB/YeaQ/YmgE family stress response membrane protein [Methylocella sp.]|nr:GlsB/YeaQ/YmgE family stress response membrane protein [Methylocella sp.]
MIALIIWLLVGAAAGWIAGIVVRGSGFGPVSNIILGILGSIVAGILFPLLGIAFIPGLVGDVVYAAVGAIILLVVVSWIKRA